MSAIDHTCHAIDCAVSVAPELLMCPMHWRMVPSAVQARIWRYYRPGQCDDKSPSEEWLSAARDAINAVAEREGKKQRLVAPTSPPEARPSPFVEWFHRFMDDASLELLQRIEVDPYIIAYQNPSQLRAEMTALDAVIVTELGVAKNDPRRLRFHAWRVMEFMVSRDGHTAVRTESVIAYVCRATEASRAEVIAAIKASVDAGHLAPYRRGDESWLQLPLLAESERRVAERVAARIAPPKPEPPAAPVEAPAVDEIDF